MWSDVKGKQGSLVVLITSTDISQVNGINLKH